MLFKTRVGLCSLSGNFEILTYRRESGDWWLTAQVKAGEAEGTSLFKKIRFGGSWFHLAAFSNHTDVQAEIGKAMQLIADSIESAAPICDLSQVGSTEAWGSQWKQIRWV